MITFKKSKELYIYISFIIYLCFTRYYLFDDIEKKK